MLTVVPAVQRALAVRSAGRRVRWGTSNPAPPTLTRVDAAAESGEEAGGPGAEDELRRELAVCPPLTSPIKIAFP